MESYRPAKASTPRRVLLAIMAGIAIMFFYGLVVKSLDPQYVAVAPEH